MKTGDVFVHHARISVRANDATTGVPALHVAEAQLPRILEDLGRSVGNEFIALRHVAVHLSAWIEAGHRSPIALERSLRAALATRVEQARRAAPRGGVSKDVAWFPTEAAAIAGYLGSLAEPTGDDWAFSVFQPLGSTWLGVLERCAERGRAFAGDVLAEALTRLGEDTLIREAVDARALTNIWTNANDQMLDELPIALASNWSGTLAPTLSADQAALVTLARLFVRWPPARALAIRPVLLTPPSRVAESPVPAGTLDSRGGGLVVWAELLSRTGLAREIASAYPNPRARGALLWALGRALEDPSMSARDPLLLLFSGEEPGRALFPDFTLRETDPDQLHSVVLRTFAQESGPAAVRVSPFGDGVVAVADPRIVVDWIPSSSVHDAISSVAERCIRCTGVAPASIDACTSISREDLDLIHAVDVPSLPDNWRAAVMSAASVAIMLLGRQWNASHDECRGWRASLTNDAVTLRKQDARRVANGTWLKRASVCMSHRDVIVSLA